MTSGPLFGKILLFVLPMMATNLLQVAYNAADMMIVSLSSEANAVGAIGTTSAFINLVLNVFIGFATGANVIVARHIGAREDREASRAVHTALIIGACLGIACTGIGIAVSRPVLMAMNAEGNLLELAVRYSRIYFCGAPFMALTNYAVAILRSKGDTKTPLYILSISGIVNVGFNIFFVVVCGMSVEGVAIATVIANVVSAILLLWRMSRDDGPCRFSFKHLTFDRRSFKNIFRIGLPAAIQGALFSFSNIIIQSSIIKMNNILSPGTEYEPVVEGNAAVANLNGFIYTATNSVCQASVAFTSQNVGACRYDRIKKVMLDCYIISVLVGLTASGIVIGLNRPLLALYGITDGAEGTLKHIAYSTAWAKLMYESLPYCLLAFMEVGQGVVRGLGRSLTSTIISLVGACLLRIVWIFTVFDSNPSLPILYMSYPITWTITGVVVLAVSIILLRKDKRKYEQTRGRQPIES